VKQRPRACCRSFSARAPGRRHRRLLLSSSLYFSVSPVLLQLFSMLLLRSLSLKLILFVLRCSFLSPSVDKFSLHTLDGNRAAECIASFLDNNDALVQFTVSSVLHNYFFYVVTLNCGCSYAKSSSEILLYVLL
jgi:hypothetical protein